MRVGEAFGQALRATRERRGMTLDETISRCEELNGGDALSLDKARLSRLERSKGNHAIRLDQWLLLAAALDTPPLLLLVPLGSSDLVEVTATSQIHPDLAYTWLTGEAPLAATSQKSINVAEWHRMSEPIRLYRLLREAQDRLLHIDGPFRPGSGPEMHAAYDKLAKALLNLTRAGLDAPDQSPWRYARLAEVQRHPDGLGVGLYTPDHWFEDHGPAVMLRHPLIEGSVPVAEAFASAYVENGNWMRSSR